MTPTGQRDMVTDGQIRHMVHRFLGWRIPDGFHPDAGISFEPLGNKGQKHEFQHNPTGTNLFDATQAEAMVRYMVTGLSPVIDGEALEDWSLNLQGVHHDLTHQFDPDDGGVCARTVNRIINEIEAARAALASLPDSDTMREALEPFASFAEHGVDEVGWVGQSGNERISDWFGPSDFRKASTALGNGGDANV